MRHTSRHPIQHLERIYALIDKPTVSHVDMYRLIFKFFHKYKYKAPLPNLLIDGCYRASKLKSDESHEPMIKRFGPPDPEWITNPGRCNWPKQPMFYCSNDNIVPILEVRTKQDDIVAVSKWVAPTRSGEDRSAIAISPLVIGLDRVIETFGDGNHSLRKFRDDKYKITPNHVKRIDEYLGNKFAEDTRDVPNIYKFTSAVSRCLLNDMADRRTGQSASGLMYPSIQSKFTGINLALKPEFFNRMRLAGVGIYKVEEYTADEPPYSDPNKPFYSMAGIRNLSSSDDKGNTIWKPVSPINADKRLEFSPATPTFYGIEPPTID